MSIHKTGGGYFSSESGIKTSYSYKIINQKDGAKIKTTSTNSDVDITRCLFNLKDDCSKLSFKDKLKVVAIFSASGALIGTGFAPGPGSAIGAVAGFIIGTLVVT